MLRRGCGQCGCYCGSTYRYFIMQQLEGLTAEAIVIHELSSFFKSNLSFKKQVCYQNGTNNRLRAGTSRVEAVA